VSGMQEGRLGLMARSEWDQRNGDRNWNPEECIYEEMDFTGRSHIELKGHEVSGVRIPGALWCWSHNQWEDKDDTVFP